jgi:hypothetical protein
MIFVIYELQLSYTLLNWQKREEREEKENKESIETLIIILYQYW